MIPRLLLLLWEWLLAALFVLLVAFVVLALALTGWTGAG